ncbi:MAG: hypothetical protein DRJ09_06555 [Bacteroidetes bacterium]|nr:MAG: hypothetical protein DRJ09_06555 [Bacteroidota bacterium]
MSQTRKKLYLPGVLYSFILMLLLVSQPVLCQVKHTTLPLSLEGAVDSAMNNNPKVRQYKALVKQKEYLLKAAKGNYLPSVDANGGYTWLSKNPEVNMGLVKNSLDESLQAYSQALAQSGAIPADMLPVLGGIMQQVSQMPMSNIVIDQNKFPNLNVAAVQPIYTGGKITAGLRFAKADKKSAEQQLEEVKDRLIRETLKNYYSVVLLQKVVQTRERVLAGMRKHERQAEKAYDVGMINRQDLLRAKVAVANAERDLSDDKNKLSLAMMALKTNMGIQSEVSIVLTDTLKFKAVPLDIENLQQQALLHQPIFKMINQQEKMVQQKKIVERSAFLPQVAVWGQYSAFQDEYPVEMPPAMIGVQATINLFDGFKKINNLKATRRQQQQVVEAREYAHQQVNLWINQSYRKVLNARERYLKMKPTVTLSDENLKVTEKRFQEGLSKSIDVIDARLMDEKIRIEQLHSLYDYNIALADVYLATGQPEKAIEVLKR